MTKDQIVTALMHFQPEAKWEISTEADKENVLYDQIIWKDAFHTKPTEQELQDYFQLSQNILKAGTDYRIERRHEYPKIEDQLDILFHEGYDSWKEKIQKIKDKYPKPS